MAIAAASNISMYLCNSPSHPHVTWLLLDHNLNEEYTNAGENLYKRSVGIRLFTTTEAVMNFPNADHQHDTRLVYSVGESYLRSGSFSL